MPDAHHLFTVTRDDFDLADLQASLTHWSHEQLTWFTRFFTGKPPTNKQGLVELLLSQMGLPGLLGTLELVGEEGRKVLALAAHGNGLLCTARAAVPGIMMGSWQQTWDKRRDTRNPSSVVWLFFPNNVSMPSHLRQRLAALLPAQPQPSLEPLVGTPSGADLGGDALADLGLVLESVRAGQLQLTKTGLSTPSVRRLAASLSCRSQHAATDVLRLRCLTSLLIASGWLRRTAKGLEPGQTEPDQRALQTLFKAFRDWRHDELHDLTNLSGSHDEYMPISEPVARRAALLQALGRCPVGAWLDFDGFVRHAAATEAIEPILKECRVSIISSYVGSMTALGQPGLIAVRNAWIRLVLACYLAPLGVVEVALAGLALLPPMKDSYDDNPPDCISQADRVVAFRLTPLGAWLLGVGAEPAAVIAQSGGWRIQADGSVVSLSERILPAERVLLDRIAERLDERSWRLERSRVIAVIAGGDQAGGEKPEVMRERLTKLSGSSLPDTVGRMLDDAARRATAVRVEALMIMLVVNDPHAREQLLHDRSTRALCRDCGGSMIGVAPAALVNFRRAARKLDWHIPEHHVD